LGKVSAKFFKNHVISTEYYMEDEIRRYGAKVLSLVWCSRDFARMMGNENPYGPSSKVIEAIKRSIHEIYRYPEPTYIRLLEKLSEYVGVGKENILIGAGSMELIDSTLRAFIDPNDEVVLSAPTYKPYLLRIRICGGKPVLIPMRRLPHEFRYDVEGMLEAVTPRTKAVVIINPNNPTGALMDGKRIEEFLDKEVLVMVDEAYFEFSGKTVAHLAPENENLIVLRSMSKAFGIAGLRVGYAIMHPKVADYIRRVQLPFRLSELSAAAALAALEDIDYMRETVKKIVDERERLFDELKKINGLHPYKSNANFILVGVKRKDVTAGQLSSKLLSRGVIVRDFTGAPGLEDGSYFRVSVSTPENNAKLVNALKGILGE